MYEYTSLATYTDAPKQKKTYIDKYNGKRSEILCYFYFPIYPFFLIGSVNARCFLLFQKAPFGFLRFPQILSQLLVPFDQLDA